MTDHDLPEYVDHRPRRGPLDDIEAILPVGEALLALGVAFIAGFLAGLATAWVL